ncbi:MAG: aquaporin [Pirellulales bacterium]|nr:aquaporin [Pirellulales bacterium]
MNAPRNMLAEAIGTFFLCFAGIGAILSTQSPINSGAGLVGIALAHGLALSVAVNAFGGISGAHFNPAVTLGMLITGRIKLDGALQYILAQLAGASVAAWACQSLFPLEAVNSAMLGIPLPSADNMPGVEGAWLTVGGLCACEFILSFLLMTAIFGTAVDPRGQAVKIGGFGIGLTVTFDILAGGPITGASMNPARSFGPALIYKLTGGEAGAGAFDLHWCYWVAPIAGAVVAALVYDNLLLGDEEE